MRAILIIITIGLFTVAAGCSKHNGGPPFQPPPTDWVVASPTQYPYSMTAVVEVPDNVSSGVAAADMMAAFIGTTCRGVGVQETVNGNTEFYILIRGTASEQSQVYFKYYNSVKGWLYTTGPDVPFAVDSVYGSPDYPAILYGLQQTR